MKRPPGLWILLSAGVLWLSLQDVYGIRATALIFGKSSTTTTEASPNGADSSSPLSTDEEGVTESTSEESANATKLSGNPQIDYVYDPNLPKELNGYNLSEYPFYERVPEYETIDFKCDGLHDGFYASIPHKCQVYHHCLFGTRYDFLCANYTAFDQKTFICHFVSEVDCVNSMKFWHRNDELYKPASTTTTPRPYNLNIYTRPPDVGASANAAPTGSEPSGPARPLGGARRRPMRRRRPLYDYYEFEDYEDDYYDERPRPRRRKQRPRHRRPIYEDDYEYEDERYERRRPGRRDEDDRKGGSSHDRRVASEERRPMERRKNKDRRKHEDEIEDEDPRFDKSEEEERRPTERKRTNHDRYNEKRRPMEDDYDRRPERPSRKGSRRPIYEDEYEEEPINDRKTNGNKRKNNNEKPLDESGKSVSKIQTGTIFDRPRVTPKIKPPVPQSEAHKYAYKSAGGSSANTKASAPDEEYYDEYEEEPLPKNSKPSRTKPDSSERGFKPAGAGRDETKENRKPVGAASRNRPRKPDDTTSEDNHKSTTASSESRKRKRPTYDEEYYEDYEENAKPSPPKRGGSFFTTSTTSTTSSSSISSSNSEERYSNTNRKERPRRPEVKKEERAPSSREERPATSKEETSGSKEETKPHKTYWFKDRSTSTTTTTTTTTTEATISKETPPERDHIVRIVKRPFLPSRGGNPYSSRGLQPVGNKALDKRPETVSEEYPEDPKQISRTNLNKEPISAVELEENVTEKPFKASPVLIKLPVRTKFTIPQQPPTEPTPREVIEEYRPITQRPVVQNVVRSNGPRTTQKPKVASQNERNPLDINENEYDVTLNDALNPTLPNLPVRGFPTGFSAQNDYTYSAFTRPRYVLDPLISPSTSDYVYQNKPRRYETVAQTQGFINNNRDQYLTTANAAQFNTNNQQQSNNNYRSRLAQSQPQTFYSSY